MMASPLRESQPTIKRMCCRHGSLRGSFVPSQPTRELRHLTLPREFGAVDQPHRQPYSEGTRRYQHQVSFRSDRWYLFPEKWPMPSGIQFLGRKSPLQISQRSPDMINCLPSGLGRLRTSPRHHRSHCHIRRRQWIPFAWC